MNYNRFKSWAVWDQDQTTNYTSDPKIWTTTSALGLDGKAVSKIPEIKSTEGMWSNLGQNNLGMDFAQGIKAGSGLKIQPEVKTKIFDGTPKGTSMGLNVASKVLGMLAGSKKQKQAVGQDMGFSGKADAAVPNVTGAIANANVHDDLIQYV